MRNSLLCAIVLLTSSFGLKAQCFNATVISTPESCTGCCDASVGLSVTGGCTPGILWANGDTTMIVNNLCGGTVLDFSLFDHQGCCSDSTGSVTALGVLGVEEQTETEKTLIRISDYLGRESPLRKNSVLIYHYSDGTTKKVYMVE